VGRGGIVDENTNLVARPFLLMEGGLLFHLQRRMGLIRKNKPFLKRTALLAALFTWLPLLILSW
jgi:hypothetical protein